MLATQPTASTPNFQADVDHIRTELLREHMGATYGDGTGLWPSLARSAACVTKAVYTCSHSPEYREFQAHRIAGALDMLTCAEGKEAALIRDWFIAILAVLRAHTITEVKRCSRPLADASQRLRRHVSEEQRQARIDCTASLI
jgi:hypothetical protein